MEDSGFSESAIVSNQSFKCRFFICTLDGDAARNSAKRSTVFHRRAISRTVRILCNSFLTGINLSLASARVSPLKSIGNANYVCEISQRLAGAAPSDKKWRVKSTGKISCASSVHDARSCVRVSSSGEFSHARVYTQPVIPRARAPRPRINAAIRARPRCNLAALQSSKVFMLPPASPLPLPSCLCHFSKISFSGGTPDTSTRRELLSENLHSARILPRRGLLRLATILSR